MAIIVIIAVIVVVITVIIAVIVVFVVHKKICPDAFHVFAIASTAAVVACPVMNIYIPNLR